MSLSFRRVFFYFYIGLFLLAAPLVVLYTAGYRFDFAHGRIVHVGALAVTSLPKGATVTADGAVIGHTPLLKKRFLPGSYQLTISKDGYAPWQREVEIKSQQTTTVQNAVLFLPSVPHLLADLKPVLSEAAPDGSTVAYLLAADPWLELWTLQIQREEYHLLDRFNLQDIKKPSLHWSHDGYLLMLEDTAAGERPTSFYTASGPLSSIPSWFATFHLMAEGTHVTLSKNLGQPLAVLAPGDYHIADVFNRLLLLRDWVSDRLVLIDTQTQGPPILLSTTATFYRWDDNRLMYSDGVELHRYDPEHNTDTLITRSGAPIQDAMASPVGQLTMTVETTSVTATDLSDQSRPVNTTIATAESIQSFWTDKDGKTGYFFGTLKGLTGLFTVPLTKGF